MNKSRTIRTTAALASILLATSPWLPGAMGELDTPNIPFGDGGLNPTPSEVNLVLRDNEYDYVGGHWLNSWTSLRYCGDTKVLNSFLAALAHCPGIVSSIDLRGTNHPAHLDCDWHVGHLANSNRIQVSINLSSPRITAESIHLPDIAGPPPAEEELLDL